MDVNDNHPDEAFTHTKNDPAIVISRNTYNLVLSSIVFFMVGIVVGGIGHAQYAANSEELIQRAVNTAIAQQQAQPTDTRGNLPTLPAGQSAKQFIDDDPFIGNGDAPVTIVEFSDFNCRYCKRFHDETLQALLDAYEGEIQFVYRDYAILGQSSTDSAVAAECANEQGAFWEYHDLLFQNQGAFSQDELIGYAEQLELDIDAFSACLEDPEFINEVQQDSMVAKQIGARGTPAFLINGQFVSGAQPFEAFTKIIDQELAVLSDS